MTLLLNNNEIESVLTMKHCLDALQVLYEELGTGSAGSFPRQDVHVSTQPREEYPDAPVAHYMKTMGGTAPSFGVSAVRMSSDICAFPFVDGRLRRVKIPVASGNQFLGLVLLYSSQTGELLSIMNDGFLSRMRVGGTNGIAAKYLAREDADSVGLFGSGWQAGAQLMALCEVRDIRRVNVFSPHEENRKAFARQMTEQLNVEVIPVDRPEKAAEGADIIVTATNARHPIVFEEWLTPGVHVSTLQRNEIEPGIYQQLNPLIINTHGLEWNFTSRELREANENRDFEIKVHPYHLDIAWQSFATLADLVTGKAEGRKSEQDQTGFVNNLGHGAQFAAVGAKVYQLAKNAGLGREIPTDWFLQDVHP